MPFCLIAGVVAAAPKSNLFPSEGRPYASVVIDADDTEFRVVGHGDEIPAVEALQKGDAVSVQGSLVLVHEKGRLAGLYVVARQVNALCMRSRNKLPVSMSNFRMSQL